MLCTLPKFYCLPDGDGFIPDEQNILRYILKSKGDLVSLQGNGSPGLSSLMTTALMLGSLAALTSSLHITELAISCTQQTAQPCC